jgi:Spy/CpxP family protein refolding chaperone
MREIAVHKHVGVSSTAHQPPSRDAYGATRILNDNPSGTVYVATMTKLIALVAAGLFAAGTMFAGEHGDCSKKVGNEAKAACQASLASLNLTPEQKTKMDAVMAEHEKAGCSEASEAKYMQEAKGILTKEQYTKFEAQCKKGEKDKTQT